jgi:hypothetical protein
MADDCGLGGFVGAADPEIVLSDQERVLGLRNHVRESHVMTMHAWSLVGKVQNSLLEMQVRNAPGVNAEEFKRALNACIMACSALDRLTDITYPIVSSTNDTSWDIWLVDEQYAPTKPTNPQTEEPLQ